MDPENPESKGLLHFYQEEHPEKVIDGKKAKSWKFLTQDKYEEQKDSLPNLCFATRHNIKGLAEIVEKMHQNTASDAEWQYSGLPDLSTVQAELSAGPSEPTYYARMNLDNQEECQGVSEALAFKGGQEFDLNPVVFIRSKKSLSSAAVLPVIDIVSLFTKAEGESAQIAFTVKNRLINMREIQQIEVSDPSTTELLKVVK